MFAGVEECSIVVNVALDEVKDGFWITVWREFTKGSDCRYFILPNHITKIEKL